MKRYTIALGLLMVFLVSLGFGPNPKVWMQGSGSNKPATMVTAEGGMPSHVIPSHTIPYHKPGHPVKTANYTTQVQRMNAAGVTDTVQLTSLDAMLADGVIDDPLQGNYRLVTHDKLMLASYHDLNDLSLQTFELVTPTLNAIPGSEEQMGNHRFYDIAAGDLNGDGVDEQITAWIGNDNHINLSTGEMPNAAGNMGRVTASPAVISGTGSLDLFVRGYDDALWYHDGTGWQSAGGHLLSGPTVVSRAAGQFDVFAFGLDDDVEPNYAVIWHNRWGGTTWDGWEKLDDSGACSPPSIEQIVPTPELPAPTVVSTGSSELDLFWRWSDNTLCHRHFDGTSWAAVQNLDGMLASDPGAVAHDGQIDVFARGVDDALWTLSYDGSWGEWQRIDRSGMPGGVTIASAPAVVSPTASQLLVVVRGSDDQLWRLPYDGSVWGNWQSFSDDSNKSTSGAVGRALALDGVDDYVDLPDNFPDVTEFTFTAWVYWNGGSSWQRIFDFGQNTTANMFLTPSNGTNARFAITTEGSGTEQRLNASTPLTQTEWVHVAVTLDGSTGVLYVNGSPVDTQTIALTPHDVVGLNAWLGDSQYPADPTFNGKLDEVAVFNRALSAPEIHAIYSSGWDPLSGKIMALHLDENPAMHGTVLTDASGSGNNGTLYSFDDLASAPAATTSGGQIDVFARTREGRLKHVLYDGSTWTASTDIAPLPVGDVYHLQSQAYIPALSQSTSTMRDLLLAVETGHFTGDGHEQIALAYQSGLRAIQIELYDVQDGFEPVASPVANLETPVQGSYPAIAVADVDGDGIDEIGIVSGEIADYRFEVFKFDRDSAYLHSYYFQPVWANHGYQIPEGTLRIEAGDIVPESSTPANDEFIVVANGHNRDGSHDQLLEFIHLYDNDKPSGEKLYPAFPFDTFSEGGTWSDGADLYRIGFGLAVGDVNGHRSGDGIDEVVVTIPQDDHFGGAWPNLARKVSIFRCCDQNNQLVGLADYELSGSTGNSYLDTLAVGDLDRDLRDEIVFYQEDELQFFEYNPVSGDIELQSTIPSASGVEPHVSLAMGDFTGDSLRVGLPTYRLESQVGGLIALINEPPKHFDTIDDVDYDINSTDSGTYASYENEQSQSTEMSLQVTRDWGMASGMEVTAGDPDGTHVTTSIGNTYGQHFESAGSNFNEITFGSSLLASNDDLVDYSRTDYQVWEYPIYNDFGSAPASYMTVVFPQPVGNNQGTVNAWTPGNSCDFWYQPKHEINNVWSYPMDVTGFTDFDSGNGSLNDYQPFTLGGVEGDFWTSWLDVKTEDQASSVNLGVSAGVEAQVGGDKIPIIGYRIPWSVKAHFNASYEQGTLSTQTVQGSDSTEVHAHFNPIDSAASYEVTPYLYWAQDGYLVMDYVTTPNPGSAFWSRYNKPDPAFIRPWADGHCGADRADFSKEVVVSPAFVSNGQTITATAVVRNYSNYGVNNVKVRFYQGDPAQGGVQLGTEQVIATLDPRGLERVSTQSPIYGSGEQKIYAVIDTNQQPEMHTENNKAYGVVMMGASDYIDPGQVVQQSYIPVTYTGAISIAVYAPPENFAETTRFEVKETSLDVSPIVGEPFEVLAYQGSSSGGWDSQIDDFDLKPAAGDAPTVVVVTYDDVDIAGMDEGNLQLYRLSGSNWVEATCSGYATEHLIQDNIVAVPVCRTGTFVLAANIPVPQPPTAIIYLPLVLKNAP